MEKITNIEIKNFKSIRHQKIDGCKRINVFVGKPNVGKSNILEALSLYSLPLLKEGNQLNINNLTRINEFSQLFFSGNILEDVLITVNDKSYLDIQYLINNTVSLNIGSIPDLNIASFKQVIKSASFPVLSTIVSDVQKIANFPNEVNTLPFKIKKYSFKEQNELSPQNKNSTNSSYLDVPIGQNLAYIIFSNSKVRKEVAELFKPYNLKLLLDNGGTAIRVAKTIDEETIFSIPISQIADTLQRLIFFKAAIKTNNKSVLLFEEPESHMYPPYISKFTSDIIFDENDNQYFIATHSPYVLNDFMEDAKDELSIYLVDYKNGETIVYRLDDEEMHIAYQFGYDFFMNIENFIPHTAHEKV